MINLCCNKKLFWPATCRAEQKKNGSELITFLCDKWKSFSLSLQKHRKYEIAKFYVTFWRLFDAPSIKVLNYEKLLERKQNGHSSFSCYLLMHFIYIYNSLHLCITLWKQRKPSFIYHCCWRSYDLISIIFLYFGPDMYIVPEIRSFV